MRQSQKMVKEEIRKLTPSWSQGGHMREKPNEGRCYRPPPKPLGYVCFLNWFLPRQNLRILISSIKFPLYMIIFWFSSDVSNTLAFKPKLHCSGYFPDDVTQSAPSELSSLDCLKLSRPCSLSFSIPHFQKPWKDHQTTQQAIWVLVLWIIFPLLIYWLFIIIQITYIPERLAYSLMCISLPWKPKSKSQQ